ncbi:VOC family protein [Dyella sp. S184]|uniref:VOC family protein n=1 Tax=Dyella sp. S184 TaxID=1641862 RepID=UPI0031B68580
MNTSLLLQKVDHVSRIHLNIEADDLQAKAARLEGLGARRAGLVRDRWWLMEAPNGHRFMSHEESLVLPEL